MTQEGKELLLQDLCARLPYGVMIQIPELFYPQRKITEKLVSIDDLWRINDSGINIEHIKPYLRPMSSMTEEEKEEIALIRDRDFQSVRKWVHNESIKETGNICPVTFGEIDYCNKKHLDYRGLIPKGLALEAPDGMYKNY